MKKMFILIVVIAFSSCVHSIPFPNRTLTYKGIVTDSLGKKQPNVNLVISLYVPKLFTTTITKVGTVTTDSAGYFKFIFEQNNGTCETSGHDISLDNEKNGKLYYILNLNGKCIRDYERDYEIIVVKR